MSMKGIFPSPPLTLEKAEDVANWAINIIEPYVDRFQVAGSIRRKKKRGIHDIDILVKASSSDWRKLKGEFQGYDIQKSGGRTFIVEVNGVPIEIRNAPKGEWGSYLDFLTGPGGRNIGLRKKAKKRGMKLSQHGLFDRKTGKRIAGKTEKGIYRALNLYEDQGNWKPPEDR